MSEPKKETVRIVLPPRRDGQPAGSNPRETAMINLPSKPAAVPPPAGSVPPPPPSMKPPSLAPAAPVPPSGIQPPKPPAAPGLRPPILPAAPGLAPKPPGSVPPPAPGLAKPPGSVAPAAPAAPGLAKPPSISTTPVAPAPLKADTKKETAKVPPSAGPKIGLPQATVQLSQKPDPSKSVSASAIKIAAAPVIVPSSGNEVSPLIGALAAAASFIALAIQIWFFL